MRLDVERYRDVWRCLGWLLLAILACRLTSGAAVAAIAIAGILAMGRNRPAVTIICYMLMPLLLIINGTLRGEGALFGLLVRLCPIGMTAVVLLQAMRRRGSHAIPLGMLYVYLVVAAASSVGGWCPPISFLKIANFLIFLIGIHLGTMNMHHYPHDLWILRNALLAFAVFVILGSIATIPFPSIGYSMFLGGMSQWVDIYDEAEFLRNFQGTKLFSGITVHSQCLSPMVVSCATWTFLDLLFIERRTSWLHIALICASPILLFMSRSRMGFVGFVFSMSLVYIWAIPKSGARIGVKRKMQQIFISIAPLWICGLAWI